MNHVPVPSADSPQDAAVKAATETGVTGEWIVVLGDGYRVTVDQLHHYAAAKTEPLP